MEKILTNYSPFIKTFLQSYLNEKSSILNFINQWGYDVSKRLKDFSINGKIIRGSIILFTEVMYGREINDESIKLAAAVELFHSGLLVHDDIIDCDELRRGDRSIFSQYKIKGANEKIVDPHYFGISMGICAGDIAFFIGFELLSSLKIDDISKGKIQQLFSREFVSVGLGQMQDVYFGKSIHEPNENEILKLYLYKTARYTFSLPFMLGGLLAGIDSKNLQLLEKLGEYLGLIFQMKDDELGIFGVKSNFGKPIGSDIKEEKKTLFHLYLFQQVTRGEKNRLRKIFGSTDVTARSIKYVQDLIIKYKIKEKIDKKINEYKTGAEEVILDMDIEDKYKEMLHSIIDYNLNRIK
jgi:geranylgeranyl diphosphate synthase, type I